MGPLTLGHYLSLGGVLFALSVVGIFMIVARGHGRNVPIPFGPYLAGGGVTALLGYGLLNAVELATNHRLAGGASHCEQR